MTNLCSTHLFYIITSQQAPLILPKPQSYSKLSTISSLQGFAGTLTLTVLTDFLLLMQHPLSTDTLEQEGFINSPTELEGPIGNRLQFLEKLGEGSFGLVASALDKTNNKMVAVKKIKLGKKHNGVPGSALREIAILKSLNHPNIVKIEDVFYDFETPHLFFLLEYHPTNLYELLREKRNTLDVRQIQSFSSQILRAVNHLHSRGILHRDIKPQNCLISQDGQLRLCDFGQSKHTYFKAQQHTPDISTLWYRAPEILMGSPTYDQKIDLWAVGCIIAELFIGHPIFLSSSELGLLFTIFRLIGTPRIEDYPQIASFKDFSSSYPKFEGEGIHLDQVPKQAEKLIRMLLKVNPNQRISAEETLRHEFFLGVEE